MIDILLVLSCVVCLGSLFAIIFPQQLLSAAQKIPITTTIRVIGFVIRTIWGIIMILVAGSTRFPQTIYIIGILLIVAGVTALLMGNAKLKSLKDWFLLQNVTSIRIGGIAGILFGGFLIYALV